MRGYLSLGSNLGDRLAYLQAGLRGLEAGGVSIRASSSVFETAAVEVVLPQAPYFNLTVQIETRLPPHALLSLCQDVELTCGRARPYHHAPRTLDIDILLLEGLRLNDDNLVIPHPGLETRGFVIYPLAQIAPDLMMPSGRCILDVKKALGDDEIVEICKMTW